MHQPRLLLLPMDTLGMSLRVTNDDPISSLLIEGPHTIEHSTRQKVTELAPGKAVTLVPAGPYTWKIIEDEDG